VPHIIIEHSKAISKHIDVENLLDALHECAIGIESLPIGGIRTRAHEATISRVGDGKADRNFIYITIRLGQGRSEQVKRDIGDKLFAVLTDFTSSHFDAGHAISLGLEIQEIDKNWTWKKNNIHQIIKDETHG